MASGIPSVEVLESSVPAAKEIVEDAASETTEEPSTPDKAGSPESSPTVQECGVFDKTSLIFDCKNGRRDELDFDELASFFKKNGFLIIHKFFSDEEMDVATRCAEHFAETDSFDWYRYFNEVATSSDPDAPKTDILGRVEHIRGFQPDFDGIVTGDDVQKLMGKIWPNGSSLIKDKINMKLPGQGPDLLHQDIQAGWRKYAPDLISMAVFLDDNTKENAAMSVMCTGKHAREQLTPDFELLPNPYPPFGPAEDYLLAAGPRGSIVLFDAFVPHGSPGNESGQVRRNFFATWNPSEFGDHYDQYFADKLKNFPPNNMRSASKDYRYKA